MLWGRLAATDFPATACAMSVLTADGLGRRDPTALCSHPARKMC